MSKEYWKDIPNYEGLYQVSNLGRVKRLESAVWNGYKYVSKKEHILKPHTNTHGYPSVILCKNGKHHKNHRVHRLVAQAFIPNPQNKIDINHINGIKTDNRVKNLEWVTRSENLIHAFKTGLNHGYPIRKIHQYDLNGNFIKTWDSISDAERYLGISHSHICRCCSHQFNRKTAGGYIWEYADEGGGMRA